MEPKMPNEGSDKRFALLIDADNVSSKYIKPILDELSKYGTVTIKRIYGDWTLTLHAKWKDALLENSITPIQQFSYTYGKNATDSAMIIDAMDILYGGQVEGFCLVSSDSDFTRLASRLRESGLMVVGMGEKKTPTPFRRACDVFTTLELLVQNTKSNHSSVSGGPTLPISVIEQAVVDIITDNSNNGKATGLGEVGSRLLKRYPEFDVRSYGTNLLSKLLEDFSRVVIKKDRNNLMVELAEGTGALGAKEEPAVTEVPEKTAAPVKKSGDKPRKALPKGREGSGSAKQTNEGAVAESAPEVAEAKEALSVEHPDNPMQPEGVPEPGGKAGKTYRVRRNRRLGADGDKPVAGDAKKPVPDKRKSAQAEKSEPASEVPHETPKQKQQNPASFIQSIVDKAGATGMNVADVGNALRRQFKNFKVKDLGYPRLATYLQEQPLFRVERRDGVVYVFTKNHQA